MSVFQIQATTENGSLAIKTEQYDTLDSALRDICPLVGPAGPYVSARIVDKSGAVMLDEKGVAARCSAFRKEADNSALDL